MLKRNVMATELKLYKIKLDFIKTMTFNSKSWFVILLLSSYFVTLNNSVGIIAQLYFYICKKAVQQQYNEEDNPNWNRNIRMHWYILKE